MLELEAAAEALDVRQRARLAVADADAQGAPMPHSGVSRCSTLTATEEETER